MRESWHQSRRLNRNQLLERIRIDGGVTPLPDFVTGTTYRTLGEFALVWIAAMEHEMVCADGLWMPYIDTVKRRITFAPVEWIQMAAESAVANEGCFYVGMPS